MANTFKFILVGKTGNGKSATGNSILGRNIFSRQSSCVSVVSKPSAGRSVSSSTHIAVVDGLNFYRCQEKSDFSDVEQSLRLCSDEFSALLIVLKFGSRFGEEDNKVLKMAKTVFGENVLKDFGVCVLTHGDNFRHAVEEEEETFVNVHQWFDQQTGKVQDLFNECGRRCVLFDNNTKSAQMKAEQVKDLFCIVGKMPRRYTLRDFEDAEKCRRSLVGSEKFTEFKVKSEQLLMSVRKDLQLLENDDSKQADDFEALLKKLEDQITLINKAFEEGTKYSNELIVPMSAVLEVKSKIRGKTSTRELSKNKLKKSIPIDRKKEARQDVGQKVRKDEQQSSENVLIHEEYRKMEKERINFEEFAQQKLKGWITKLQTMLWTLEKGTEERKIVVSKLKSDVVKLQTLNEICGGNSYDTQLLLIKLDHDIRKSEEPKEKQKSFTTIESSQSTPLQSSQSTPLQSSQSTPLQSSQSTPLQSSQSTPHQSSQSTPLQSSQSTPLQSSQSTPLQSSQSTPLQSSQPKPSNEINLLLVGKSGNGKSSTANSILGRKAFKTTSSTTTSVGHCSKESCQVQNIKVNVVDGPGMDLSQTTPHVLEASLNGFKEILELCEYQFSTIVVVLQYGVPLSKQEVEIMRMIRGVLGNDVIKTFGVCVLTRGDSFEYDMNDEDNPVKFEDWSRQQTDELGSLFKECNFRCVLFDNKTQDEIVARGQVQRLLSLVKPDVTYSKADFMKGLGGLKDYVWSSSLPKLIQNSTKFIDEIQRRTAESERIATSDYGAYVSELKKICMEIGEYTQLIQGIGSTSNEFKTVLQILEIAATEIKTKLKVAENDKNMTHRSTENFSKRRGDVFKETYSHERDKDVENRQQNVLGSRDTSNFSRGTQHVSEVKEPQRGLTFSYNTRDDHLADEIRNSLCDIRRQLCTLTNGPRHPGVTLDSLRAAVKEQRAKCTLISSGSQQTKELINKLREISQELNDASDHFDKGSKVIEQKWWEIRKSFKFFELIS